jgi:hypothetical protein
VIDIILTFAIWGGGAEGDRTPDLRIANATLSQLSYGPVYLDNRCVVPVSGRRGFMVIGPCSVKFAPSTDRVSRLILNRHPGESRDPFCSHLGEGSVGSRPSPPSGNRSRPVRERDLSSCACDGLDSRVPSGREVDGDLGCTPIRLFG